MSEIKGLVDMTDDELRQTYRQVVKNVDHSANNYYNEIVRRTQEKHTKAMIYLTLAIAILALIQTIAVILNFIK